MRICFLTGSFPALSETFILNQITGLLDRGHEIMIFAGARSREEEVHPEILRRGLLGRVRYYQDKPGNWPGRLLKVMALLPVFFGLAPRAAAKALDVRRYGREALSLNLFLKAAAFLEARDFDVVVAHFGANGLEAALMKDLGVVRGKIAVVFHAADLSVYPARHGQGVYRHLFECADIVLPVSDDARSRLLAMGCPSHKMRVHRMGVALAGPGSRARGDALKIVSVGRLVEKKGFCYALMAVARLKEMGVPCEYVLVGGGALGEDLKARACALGIAERVRLMGWQGADVVAQQLEDADVLLAPSILADNGDEEGIPVVLMEAMARGVCVVTTPTGGIPELVVDRQTGFLAPVKDAGALADRLKFIWENPQPVAVVAAQARSAVEKQHDINMLNAQLEKILQELLYV